MVQDIRLEEYNATAPGKHYLVLGTWDSYGIEKLHILPGTMWEGMVITATFVTPEKSVRVIVPEDGLIAVPQEATARALSLDNPGRIVFEGTSDGVQRITNDITYFVSDHAPVDGDEPAPTPSVWEQFVDQVQEDAQQAARSAEQAAASEQAAGTAAQQAETAAQAAAAELEKVEQAGEEAGSAIAQARAAALEKIAGAGTDAVEAVNAAARQGETDLADAKAEALEVISGAQKNATDAVSQAGQQQVQDIEKTGDAQADRIAALVPEVYTKTESDQRYAPIASSVKVTSKGTGLASLTPTVPWHLQGLTLYGQTMQDGTPSPESPVPLVSPGDSGQIELTVCGENLLAGDKAWTTDPNTGTVTDAYHEVVGAVLEVSTVSSLYLSGDFSLLTSGAARIAFFDKEPDVGGQYDSRTVLYDNGPIDTAAYNWVLVSLQYNSKPDSSAEKIKASFMLNLGDSPAPWQPYQSQPFLVSTPNGLPGIPVDSGGNWVDENGQEWVSDEKDYTTGIYTQRLIHETVALSLQNVGTYTRYIGSLSHPVDAGFASASLSDILDYNPAAGAQDGQPGFRIAGNLIIAKYGDAVLDSIDLVYPIAEPIPQPIGAEEMAAYAALQSGSGTTNIIAPDCGVEAAAVGDANAILTSVTRRIAALEQNAIGGAN